MNDHPSDLPYQSAQQAIEANIRSAHFATSHWRESSDASEWILEWREMGFEESFLSVMHGLASLSGGGNIFFESEFQSSAQNRLLQKATQLVLWEDVADETAPRLYLPLVPARVGFPPHSVLRAASHPYAPLSLPLTERDDIDEIACRFASLLSSSEIPFTRPLIFEDYPFEEHAALKLTEAMERHGLCLRLADRHSRAALRHANHDESGVDGALKRHINSNRRRKLNAQLRNLQELGTIRFENAVEFWDVLTRFEEFLLLESRGWKGRRHTAINNIRRTAAFARQAVGQLARLRRASVYSLRLDDRSIASLIMLKSGPRYYPWKIAYDEQYRSYAPGIQLFVHATRDLLATPGFEMADSLAASNSVVSGLWSDRIELASLIVAGGADAERKVTRLEAALNRKSQLRQSVKRLIGRS